MPDSTIMDRRYDSEETDDCSEQEENDDFGSESVNETRIDKESEESSSEMDSEDFEQEKTEQSDDMMELDEQYYQIKDIAAYFTGSPSATGEGDQETLGDITQELRVMKLFHSALEKKKTALENETDPDFLAQTESLKRERDLRHQAAEDLLQSRKGMMMKRYHTEKQSNIRSKENDLANLYDQMKEKILADMEKLAEERHWLDYDLELSDMLKKTSKRRKRAVEVTDPCIFYQLPQEDIMNDLASITWTETKQDREKDFKL